MAPMAHPVAAIVHRQDAVRADLFSIHYPTPLVPAMSRQSLPRGRRHRLRTKYSRPRGVTLIESLVVVAILGSLVALLFPVVQSVREAARKAQCSHHLKQVALAFDIHHAAHDHFPTGGWRPFWIGESRHGFRRGQPGGWTFNILPFLEQHTLYDLGAGLSGYALMKANTRLIQTPISVMHCPSRRTAKLYSYIAREGFANGLNVTQVAKLDYAVNAGQLAGWTGNTSARIPFSRSYPLGSQQATGPPRPSSEGFGVTNRGIVWFASMTRFQQVTDGASNTILIGEKWYISASALEQLDGWTRYDLSHHDDTGLFVGWGSKSDRRSTGGIPLPGVYLPFQDGHGAHWSLNSDHAFGSAHPNTMNVAFCDGSVRSISYTIAPEPYLRMGLRDDSEVGIGDEISKKVYLSP